MEKLHPILIAAVLGVVFVGTVTLAWLLDIPTILGAVEHHMSGK